MIQSSHITSIKDARVVEARELTSGAGRARLQKTQLEGEESIQWPLEAHLLVEHVFYSAGFSEQEKEQLVSYLKRIQANCATITQE